MLRSARALENFRVLSADGVRCALAKDIYFDDQSWVIKYLVLGLDPRQFGQKQVLIVPEQIAAFEDESNSLRLSFTLSELGDLPMASSVLPVCKQYASLALASPGAAHFARSLVGADPHLRSMKAVSNYRVSVADEFGGTLADFLLDDESWEIRYLSIEQVIDRRKLRFHVVRQSVERFTWATQRIVLRDLHPVQLAEDRAADQTALFVASAA